jgi:hypothetical protein
MPSIHSVASPIDGTRVRAAALMPSGRFAAFTLARF